VPAYEFGCTGCGHNEAHHHRITDAPALGSTRRCSACGRSTSVRIPSIAVVNIAKARADAKYPYVSRRWSNTELAGMCREDGGGHPIVESRRHEREIMARTGLVRE